MMIDREKLAEDVLKFLGFAIDMQEHRLHAHAAYTVVWQKNRSSTMFIGLLGSSNVTVGMMMFDANPTLSNDVLDAFRNEIIRYYDSNRWIKNPFFKMTDEQMRIFLDLNMD